MAILVPVRQMSEVVTDVEVTPDMPIWQMKQKLKALQEDDLARKVSIVQVLVGNRRLSNEDQTVAQAKISADTVVDVVFTTDIERCCSKDSASRKPSERLLFRGAPLLNARL